jgi:glucokinase
MPFLGVDIGGTDVKAGLVSREGTMLAQARTPTSDCFEAFAANMRELVRRLGASQVEGIGIACKGIIDSETTQVRVLPGTLHYLEGQFLRRFFPESERTIADNDARAALAAEVVWGAAKGLRNALMVTLGTGVGGGVLAEGRILRGAAGVAGHIGHYTIDPDGSLCICGNHGCLETVFSAKAIESEAAALIHRGAVTWSSGITCEQVFHLAAKGDSAAARLIERAVHDLAAALAGLLFLLDPEVVIVGGQISNAGAQLLDPLSQQLHARTFSLLRRRVPLVSAVLRENTGVLGAAALAMQE